MQSHRDPRCRHDVPMWPEWRSNPSFVGPFGPRGPELGVSRCGIGSLLNTRPRKTAGVPRRDGGGLARAVEAI